MLRRLFGGKQDMASSTALENCRFSVVDVETTGLFPGGHDRIVEIAIVDLDPKGNVFDEFVTLVNPERDIGPTHIHGITTRDVLDAPSFPEIAGDVASRLAGNVFVAHNARFDLDFVEAEFNRMGQPLPTVATLCTMRLAQNLVGSAPSFSLAALCEHLGVRREHAHTALEDARATTRLLGIFLAEARSRRWTTLVELGCTAPLLPITAWPHLTPSSRIQTREHAAQMIAPSYLARLAERLPTDRHAGLSGGTRVRRSAESCP